MRGGGIVAPRPSTSSSSSERAPAPSASEQWREYRRLSGLRARAMNGLLVRVGPDHIPTLRRCPPDSSDVLSDLFGPPTSPEKGGGGEGDDSDGDGGIRPDSDGSYAVSLREILGAFGAREWRRRGVAVPGLSGRIYPHHGVFAPIRSEYVRLVADEDLPRRLLGRREGEGGGAVIFDIGIGTGVLSALLLERTAAAAGSSQSGDVGGGGAEGGVARVVGTDVNPLAVECAVDNLSRRGLSERAKIVVADLFPPPDVASAGGRGPLEKERR